MKDKIERKDSYNGDLPYGKLTPDNFELLLHDIFAKLILEQEKIVEGFESVERMSGVGEKGIDCALFDKSGLITGVIQCKRNNTNLSEELVSKEVIKCILNSIAYPELKLIPESPKDFSYFMAVAKDFTSNCKNNIARFNSWITKHDKLEEWTLFVIEKYTLIKKKGITWDNSKDRLVQILTVIKFIGLSPNNSIDDWVINDEKIAPKFFKVTTIICKEEFKKLLYTRLDITDGILTKGFEEQKKDIEKLSKLISQTSPNKQKGNNNTSYKFLEDKNHNDSDVEVEWLLINDVAKKTRLINYLISEYPKVFDGRVRQNMRTKNQARLKNYNLILTLIKEEDENISVETVQLFYSKLVFSNLRIYSEEVFVNLFSKHYSKLSIDERKMIETMALIVWKRALGKRRGYDTENWLTQIIQKIWLHLMDETRTKFSHYYLDVLFSGRVEGHAQKDYSIKLLQDKLISMDIINDWLIKKNNEAKEYFPDDLTDIDSFAGKYFLIAKHSKIGFEEWKIKIAALSKSLL